MKTQLCLHFLILLWAPYFHLRTAYLFSFGKKKISIPDQTHIKHASVCHRLKGHSFQ